MCIRINKHKLKILQILEESPSLDFTIPIFEFIDNEKNQVLIFTAKPSYLNWFDHEPEKLLVKNKFISFATSVDTLFLNPILTKSIKKISKNNRDNLNNPMAKIFRKLVNYVINHYSNPIKYFDTFFNGLPDYVLIDTRNDLDIGKMNTKIFNWIEKNSIKTIGVPVSSYTIEGTKWGPITPFGKYDEKERPIKQFPSNYEFWMASNQKFVVEQLGDTLHRTVGYPGVDSKYIELIENEDSNYKAFENSINILLNVRHFGSDRNIGPAAGKYVYEDVLRFFENIKECIDENSDYDFQFIIKPHYYVNFKSFHRILKKVGIQNYKFKRTSIYHSFKNIDFVIGMHTSVNLISILFKKPTILFPQILTKELMKQDSKSEEMYKTLNGYCVDENNFKVNFKRFLDIEKRNNFSTQDFEHIRKFFQDNSIDKIIKILKL